MSGQERLRSSALKTIKTTISFLTEILFNTGMQAHSRFMHVRSFMQNATFTDTGLRGMSLFTVGKTTLPMMKYLFSTISMLLLILSQSCVEETEPGQQKLSVSFSAVSIDDQLVSDLPANSKLIINVESQAGESVMEFTEVQFHLNADGFVTRPIDLPFGSYAITDFIIVNENDEITYAVPKSSGALASDVSQPLDLQFTYTSNSLPVINNLRLLDVRNHRAEDFGYGSFRKPGHSIKIMLQEKGSSKAATGTASIMDGTTTVATYNLAAKMNHLTIPSGLSGDHTLVITKDGFAGKTFTLAELLQKKNKSLKLTLEPALTMLAHIETWYEFSFDLTGPAGKSITVDWGDGNSETREFSPDFTNFVHTYAAEGNYNITVTGDIGEITSFYSFYGQGPMDAVDFRHLTNMEDLRFGLSYSPKVLDLRYNTKLEHITVGALSSLETLYLPETHQIKSLWIGENTKMSPAALDAVIDNLYQNTVTHNTREGWFGFDVTLEDGTQSILGPPSPESLDKLRIMRNDYGWEISPDI